MTGSLQHVLVLSDDIDGTRDFYTEIVGVSVGARPPLAFAGYWLYAGATPCVHIADRTAYRAHAGTLGLHVDRHSRAGGPIDHVAFAADDYAGVLEALQQRGLAPVTNTVPGVQRQLFIDDPNGVRVELNFAPIPD